MQFLVCYSVCTTAVKHRLEFLLSVYTPTWSPFIFMRVWNLWTAVMQCALRISEWVQNLCIHEPQQNELDRNIEGSGWHWTQDQAVIVTTWPLVVSAHYVSNTRIIGCSCRGTCKHVSMRACLAEMCAYFLPKSSFIVSFFARDGFPLVAISLLIIFCFPFRTHPANSVQRRCVRIIY